eukprot:TRINITY_DN1576_c0_g2_i5.p1 TRINITY_DN1576_c0_g2~~TRINITY_DN1576_c0_g2_i5.p1  ORF type:complete len:224 (+),score=18.82 TRINITY_DN1576_c0_g2_i5:921-1592(+)
MKLVLVPIGSDCTDVLMDAPQRASSRGDGHLDDGMNLSVAWTDVVGSLPAGQYKVCLQMIGGEWQMLRRDVDGSDAFEVCGSDGATREVDDGAASWWWVWFLLAALACLACVCIAALLYRYRSRRYECDVRDALEASVEPIDPTGAEDTELADQPSRYEAVSIPPSSALSSQTPRGMSGFIESAANLGIQVKRARPPSRDASETSPKMTVLERNDHFERLIEV